MSRLIVKGLPKDIKEERLRELFSHKGHITDLSMKYTKDGVFRRFAFVGYKTAEEAATALKRHNNTFVNTSKIVVEVAHDFGDANKPRAWSKYSKDSSSYQKKNSKLQDQDEKKSIKDSKKKAKEMKKKKREEKIQSLLGDLKDDPEFQEFLDIHKNRSTKSTWGNDTVNLNDNISRQHAAEASDEEQEKKGSSEESDAEDEETEDIKEQSPEVSENKNSVTVENRQLSDMEYLKSKMKSSGLLSDTSSSESDTDEDEDDDKQEEEETTRENRSMDAVDSSEYVVKMRGLPTNIKEKQIKEFFTPLIVKSIRIPRNAKKRTIGVAFVRFAKETDVDQALRRNKNFIGGKRVLLKKQQENEESVQEEEPRPWEVKLQEQAEDGNDDETIAESGRLYVRNLSYLCTEEDLEKHFGKFGPLAEVHLPIDTFTKKVKGFAFITYVIPEHGVKAYTECDGTVFQGRMLHILPAKTKKDPSEDASDESSFKKKRQAQQKAHAGSSHNWNSLFLGANAVADVIAEKYGTSKSQLLDPESRQSVGVRMALGETHVVSETRDFLTENGVSLEAFSQGKMERSKTVMLVKNLPSGTPAEEIRTIFSKHGTVSRVILPPSGVTAIVEFLEPSEARRAFRNLAYTKFQHVPLYLEWAPVGVFTAPAQEQNQATGEGKESVESSEMTGEENPRLADKEEEEDEEAVNEPGSTLFVKNLNFDTTDEGLKQFFSSVGKVKVATVAKKKDMKKPGNFLSMGYGFVEFRGKPDAMKALKQLQHNKLDGHSVELKISERTTLQKQPTSSKKSASKKQTSTKVLIRNIPFEASLKEIRELFSTFGEIKSVRLPKKLSGTGSHRGFGFVDFLSKQDAKRAFNALCHSTHLFGRRLVLEWADTEETVEQLRKKTAEHFHEDVPRKKKKKSDLMEDLQAGGGD